MGCEVVDKLIKEHDSGSCDYKIEVSQWTRKINNGVTFHENNINKKISSMPQLNKMDYVNGEYQIKYNES